MSSCLEVHYRRPVFVLRTLVPGQPTPEAGLSPTGWDIRVACLTPTDYETALVGLWDADADLLIVEHDIHLGPLAVDELLGCPFPACAAAYQLFPSRTGLTEPVLAHRVAVDEAAGPFRWATADDDFADWAGLGATKLTRIVRAQIPAGSWPASSYEDTWLDLDDRVASTLRARGVRWHLHHRADVVHSDAPRVLTGGRA